ncbi:SOS response-associated peptidase [Roseateles sp. BYS87W]|uniref:Abasic site processing protein n=1 Tax=Pelomonas baiyunensis TaxID=3299026 RepID=A0ABW7H1S7_9BURK
MCSNYKPVTLQDRLLAHFGVARPDDAEPPELTYAGRAAPFIVRADQRDAVACHVGRYGLLPEWAPNLAFGRRTYNCRSETMRSKPSFRQAWFEARRCVIPVEVLFENCWETGDPVRWAIVRSNGDPLAVAGLWGVWHDRDGQEVLSFTMLTVNADGHGVFGRMHPPNDEKRMPVILQPAEQDVWLHGSAAQALALIRPLPAELLRAEPDPAAWKPLAEPASWAASSDLFADDWQAAARDPKARALKARRTRSAPPPAPPQDEPPADTTGDLFG